MNSVLLDLRRVGTFGVLLGGIVGGEACLHETRVGAHVMMDVLMPTAVVSAVLCKPSMWITRNAASMRLKRRRSGGWSDRSILGGCVARYYRLWWS